MSDRDTPAEISLEEGAVAIADLHLDPERAEDCAGFVEWLGELEAPRLLILGDLFDTWVGPAHQARPGGRFVLAGLRNFSDRGGELDLLHGNRDFLLDGRFERACGGRIRPAGVVGTSAGGARVLFLHGDELCTLDHAYQRLRRVTHSAVLRRLAPAVPHPLSTAIARRLRRTSVRAIAAKPAEEKALQPGACREHARSRDASVVVCGHAHEPRDEPLEDGPRWIVLGAFGEERDLLRVGAEGALELESSGGGAR